MDDTVYDTDEEVPMFVSDSSDHDTEDNAMGDHLMLDFNDTSDTNDYDDVVIIVSESETEEWTAAAAVNEDDEALETANEEQTNEAIVNNEPNNAIVNNQPDDGIINNGPENPVANNEPVNVVRNEPANTAANNGLGNVNVQPIGAAANIESEVATGNDGENEGPPKDGELKNSGDDKEAEKGAKANTSYEDDGLMCTICFEPWTCSGEHRLVSLRCGHLFGRSCIAKWVKNRDAKCPQCNARARKSEIRPIYAKSIKTLDTSERDWAVKELEKESAKRKRAELEAARKKLECDMIRQEIESLKKELIYTQMQLKESRAGQRALGKLTQNAHSTQRAFSRILQVDMKLGGCRVMDCSSILGMLAVSQPSLNNIFRGYGLRKISVPDVTLCEFVHVHQKQIKDVSFHSTDGLILSASLDKTVKIVNFLTNSIVQSYNLDYDVWSCSWDLDDPKYFYAGVRTGSVYVYDIRMTDRHVCQLPEPIERSPVASLQYLKRQPSAKHSKCGPITGQLGSCCFYEKVPSSNPFSYVANPLPLEGKFTSLSCESTTGHLLASCRPSQKHPKATHTLCELAYDTNVFSCNFVHAMAGGSTQAQLTRSKLMLHPDSDSTVLVCAGDEESKSTLIWNGCTGSLLDKLPADSPTLDITTFRWDKPVLATLTDKNVYFYNWNSI